MTVSIFLKMIDGYDWKMYSDIECKHCNKNQFYGSYISNNNSCVICNQTQETPILVIDKFPIVFENNEIVEQLNIKIQSLLVLANLLEYEVEYSKIYDYKMPYISIKFYSTINKDKIINLKIITNSLGKYHSSSIYTMEKISKKLDIFEAIEKVERIM